MDFFKMIGDLLSGTKRSPDEKPDEKPVDKPEETSVPDAVEVKARIKKATLELLDSLYDEVEVCRGKRLLVWFDTDETTYGAYAGLRDELAEHWDDERGYVFDIRPFFYWIHIISGMNIYVVSFINNMRGIFGTVKQAWILCGNAKY